MLEEIKKLRHLLSMPRAEVVSRANAWPEVVSAGRALIDACHEGGEVTSHEVAAIASRILSAQPIKAKHITAEFYNELLATAQTLAGSALSQYPGDDNVELKASELLKEHSATRALVDAQTHGQADPLIKTVVVGPDSTGPHRTDKEA